MNPKPRLLSLDVIRGLSVLGILLVNATSFAQPFEVYFNPSLSPRPLQPNDLWVWWMTETFFKEKFYTLFALLFGVSLYLVGQDHDPKAPLWRSVLWRRLAVLVVIGLIHGALIWNGDILLMYGLCGFLFWFRRHASAENLLGLGCVFFVISSALILYNEFSFFGAVNPFAKLDLSREIFGFRGTLGGSISTNFNIWSHQFIGSFLSFAPKTLGLMMIGLGLFKHGFLKGSAPTNTYLVFILLGLISLFVLAIQNEQLIEHNFPYPDTYTSAQIANEFLSLLVSLAYASALILLIKTAWGQTLLWPLTRVGRMAFSNYLMQSLIMTSLFYGGRWPHELWLSPSGPPLFGQLNAFGTLPIIMALWLFQIIFSCIWLENFRYGPFEFLWRSLSLGKWVRLK